MAFTCFGPQNTLQDLPGGDSACASVNPLLLLTLGHRHLSQQEGVQQAHFNSCSSQSCMQLTVSNG